MSQDPVKNLFSRILDDPSALEAPTPQHPELAVEIVYLGDEPIALDAARDASEHEDAESEAEPDSASLDRPTARPPGHIRRALKRLR